MCFFARMSGILSSLNKSGQFMSDEKKKGGFWSWFGLGKNKQEASAEQQDHAPQEVVAPQEQVQVSNESGAQETTEKTTALSEELKAEDVQVAQPDVSSNEVISEASLEGECTLQEMHVATSDEASVDVVSESNQADFADEVEQHIESVVDIEDESVVETEEHEEESAVADIVEIQEKPSEGSFFSRLLKGLVKTKQNIGAGFRSFFLGKKIDDELFEELEEQLLIADIGVPTTTKIINNLTQHATRQQLQNADTLYQQLKLEMGEILKPVAQPLRIDGSKKPYVILMVGVNGVGKTTTIGKLARKFQMEGKSVMLAAGDTFRAAAVEQLQVWGERNHIPVVAQSTGSDSASVIFDAMQSAAARNIDVLIADTAGRLQNKNNLMDELKKIVRVMKKYDESAPHEIMLTLDAGTGQNAISQAKLFNEAVGLTGISLTKLDGTAKGGVIFAIADQFNLPIRYIGVGEKIEDLREFNAEEFIDALFAHEEE